MTTPDILRIRIRREIAKSVKGVLVLVTYTMYAHYEIIRILILLETLWLARLM
jgi:hypothetical protein